MYSNLSNLSTLSDNEGLIQYLSHLFPGKCVIILFLIELQGSNRIKFSEPNVLAARKIEGELNVLNSLYYNLKTSVISGGRPFLLNENLNCFAINCQIFGRN